MQRTSLDALYFLKKILELCEDKPLIIADRGPWYRWALHRLGLQYKHETFGERNMIEGWYSLFKARVKRFWKRFPFHSSLESVKRWSAAWAWLYNLAFNEFRKIYVDGGNAVFEYCGIENTIEGIDFKNSQFIIQNCIIVSSIFQGIGSIDSEGEIANNTIINVSIGIDASGSSVLIKNNTIINPDIGIQIYYKSLASVISNTIQNYKEWGIRISSCKNVKIKNNTFLNGNGKGRLSQEWYLIVKVKDIFGFSIDNAWVTIYDSKGRKVIEEKTSSKNSGNNEPIAGDVVSQYIVDNNGTKIILSPYTIHIQKNEKEKTITISLDRDTIVSMKLPVFTIPSIIIATILVAIAILSFIYIKCKSKKMK